MNHQSRGFTLIELMIVVAIIAIIVAIAIPSIMRSRISANQTSAIASLDVIVKMNVQFRSNDPDRNGISDFWVENVWGLYGMKIGGGERIQMVSKSLADSDYDAPGELSTINSNTSNFSIDTAMSSASPKSGYYVAMFVGQAETGSSCSFTSDGDCYAGGDASGGSTCDNASSTFTNENQFSASAFPSLYVNTGTVAYAVDETGNKYEIRAKETTGVNKPFSAANDAPNASEGTAPVECFPSEDVLNVDWGSVD
jgi:prepilin-type N-terminal cleavage/methylation domain-containing protein